MIDLKEKVKKIIEKETENNHFLVIGENELIDKSVKLICQIFSNYEKVNDLKQDFNNLPKQGELILLVAPTGAGKDSVVVKLNSQNLDKKYIELNMDMFRYYYPIFIKNLNVLTDVDFAKETNQFSYELYYTIQEIILNEFPGTNIIITGTLRDYEWVEKSIKKYKQNKNTIYSIKIVSLVVPKEESEISAVKRYISIVDDQLKNNPSFIHGTARYTTKKYHDETFEKFPGNLMYFENSFKEKPGELIDSIEVYRRSKKINDYNEDTLEYSSKNNNNKTAVMVVNELRKKEYHIKSDEIKMLFNVTNKNSSYLKEQKTYDEIISVLAKYIVDICQNNENAKNEFNQELESISKIIDSNYSYYKNDNKLIDVFNYLKK